MIESVLIEIRPGLGTCSVCIVLKEEVEEARVKVRKRVILLNVADKDYAIHFNDFEVEPLTMTCFDSKKGNVSFRVGLSGCPKVEPAPRVKKILPIQPDETTKLTCRCGQHITGDVTFKRVLPLPSHGLELADMFCHFDNHANTSVAPRLSDCLYTGHYISVNKEVLTNVKLSSVIKCRRCLDSIGLCHKETMQLWNVCINLPYENLTPVEQFKKIIRSSIEESFAIFLKIFLECSEHKNGLLVSVMDKQLLVSRAQGNVNLKTCSVFKLKYEYYKSYNANVKRFLEKEDVQCIEVPRVVVTEGLDYLMKNSEEIPALFRLVDGELMAYLEV